MGREGSSSLLFLQQTTWNNTELVYTVLTFLSASCFECHTNPCAKIQENSLNFTGKTNHWNGRLVVILRTKIGSWMTSTRFMSSGWLFFVKQTVFVNDNAAEMVKRKPLIGSQRHTYIYFWGSNLPRHVHSAFGPEEGLQTEWKVSGKFPLIWWLTAAGGHRKQYK